MRGLRKGTIGRRGIAERRIDRHIVRHFIPDRRCIGPHRVFRMQHERQFLVGHLHRFRRVHRLRFGFGHHHGDGLADMPRFVRRQQQMRTDEHRAAAGRRKLHVELGLRQRIVRNWLEVVRGAIGASEYAKHARHRLGPLRIDCDDARVRIRRSHHRRIGLAFETEIVGETAVAGNEPRILLARHRLADEAVAGLLRPCFVVHRSSPSLSQRAGEFTAARALSQVPRNGGDATPWQRLSRVVAQRSSWTAFLSPLSRRAGTERKILYYGRVTAEPFHVSPSRFRKML